MDKRTGDGPAPLAGVKRVITIPGAVSCALILTMIFMPICVIGSEVISTQTAANAGRTGYQTTTAGVSSYRDAIAGKIKLLTLYQVIDGKVHSSVVSKEDLVRGEPIKINGYVCGILTLCQQEMNVSVDGQPMNKIKRNGDGTFQLRRYGVMKPEDLEIPKVDRAYYDEVVKGGKGETFVKGGYSLFPEVVCDAVVPGDRFFITFTVGDQSFDIQVDQKGYSPITLSSSGDSAAGGTSGVSFRCVGTDSNGLKSQVSNCDVRLAAIAQGVENIKKTFGMDLISNVNIINYKDIYNAVTSEEGEAMWFYSTAFMSEPVEELLAIGEHETLHRYVDRIGLKWSSAVREIFADLKGYDDYSFERLMLVTTGYAPQERSSNNQNGDLVFFSFINERNFLPGMKGGHSHGNVDEFCVSFIHSLMYVEHLQANLNKPIAIMGSDKPRYLTAEEQKSVLRTYARVAGIMRDSLLEMRGIDENTRAKGLAVFDKGLRAVGDIGGKMRLATDEVDVTIHEVAMR